MREILFRGKRLDYGIWEEGYYSPKDLPSYDAEPVDMPCIIREKDLLWCRVDPATVGQYTGLTDMNGKKIFEGDIWDCGGYIGVIEWVKEVCCFEARYTMNGNEYANAVSDYRAAKVEVIGNIHDNPELLEGEQNDR